MGDRGFTKDQTKVIETRGKNILVSAAAGSGKTTVLVERIIRKITGEVLDENEKLVVANEGVDIDKILVLTFTNAAAAEMRERIIQAINERIEAHPENARLVKQSVLIHNAQITTIHSFCLFLLKNHFSDVGIDPAFRIASEGEIKLIEGTVADELISELFETGEIEGFELLADRVTTKNSLANLKKLILDAYKESRNAPYMDEYFEERRQDYSCDSLEELENTQWIKFLIEDFAATVEEAILETKRIIRRCQEPGEPYLYIETLQKDLEYLEGFRETSTYKDIHEYVLESKGFESLGKKSMPEVSEDARKKAQDDRNAVKKMVKDKFTDAFFKRSPETVMEQLVSNKRIVNILIDVLQLYNIRLTEEKNRRKIIDFSDMEHYALTILVKREGGKSIPTKVARDYAGYFDEIMVDEYQDSNRIQEEILEAISAKVNSGFNRFMVGDVKQSIYSFRQACPDIFIDKYDRYATEPEGCIRIDLSKNFRSRKEVLDGVNCIFERIMHRDVGMVDYDDAAKLYPGATDYPQTSSDYTTEFLMLKRDANSKISKEEQEANLVAQRIRQLIDSKFEVYDRKEKVVRPCSYGDIVVLLRTSKGWDEVFKRVLENYGIPTFISSKTGYFSALEVRELLTLLQVLDNPRQEIPFFGVMQGFFGGFSDDEIARIRTLGKKELYDVVCAIANEDFVDEHSVITGDIIKKCRNFTEFINKWRDKKVYTLIHVLLAQIIAETGYMFSIGSLPYGEQRKANVYMLIEKAKQYESGSFKGLYHFVRFMEEIRSYDVDFGEAATLDEKADVVRIMTVHASKGLEFPICIVAAMGKQYNDSFTKEDIVFDNKLGIALDRYDQVRNVRQSDMRRTVVMRSKVMNLVSEEMRILYVAMTRAKEKLIMTGTTADAVKLFEGFAEVTGEDNLVLSYSLRSKALKYSDLIAAAVGPNGNESLMVKLLEPSDIEEKRLVTALSRAERKAQIQEIIEDGCDLGDAAAQIERRIGFKYAYENLEGLYTKTSVSELKIAALESKIINHDIEEMPAEFFAEHDSKAYVPAFASLEEKVSGTTRGTAYHRVMELFGFADNVGFDKLSQDKQLEVVGREIERMIKSGRIQRDAAELVDQGKIAGFVASSLGQRMCQAAARGELHLEEPFVLQIPASRLKSEYPDSEKVLIQGIIDAFFEEDGKIVLMDYKTDRVSAESELIDRYETQLDYYKEAIENIREAVVDEVLIYSFALEKIIESK